MDGFEAEQSWFFNKLAGKIGIMEGPSLAIACEEFRPFLGKKIDRASGSAHQPFEKIQAHKFKGVKSWGKHLILIFPKITLRIHFLMFGGYRIDDPRENRIPKMLLEIGQHKITFYSCAIKEIDPDLSSQYDWSSDLMSPEWKPRLAHKKVSALAESKVCDVLMDQNIFSGLGNIMKNEILFRLKLHPETKIKKLTSAKISKLVHESCKYSYQFYEWKKLGQLKKHWLIMRKRKCPVCASTVIKRPTGKLKRLSHYCPRCQKSL